MLRAGGAQRRRAAVALAVAAAIGGCGGDDFANDPGDPAEVTVGAVLTAKRITVSRPSVSAGTIELLASNQTSTSQRVQLRSVRLAGGGAPLAQSTGPINPGGTASLKADLGAGTYVVAAWSSDVEPATIVVASKPGSASDRLLQP
jgi:hypothetical protein